MQMNHNSVVRLCPYHELGLSLRETSHLQFVDHKFNTLNPQTWFFLVFSYLGVKSSKESFYIFITTIILPQVLIPKRELTDVRTQINIQVSQQRDP